MELKYGHFYRTKNSHIGMVVGPEGFKEIFGYEPLEPSEKHFFITFAFGDPTYSVAHKVGDWGLVERLPSCYDKGTYIFQKNVKKPIYQEPALPPELKLAQKMTPHEAAIKVVEALDSTVDKKDLAKLVKIFEEYNES